MGIGAYVSGILATRYGISFDAALPVSILVPVALALLVAVPVLRLQTHYFALATLLIGQTALLAATQWQSVTGGANGIGGVPPLSFLGHAITGRPAILLTVWALVALGALLAWRIGRGRLGDSYALLRAHPAASQAIGIDNGQLRLLAFLLSAGYRRARRVAVWACARRAVPRRARLSGDGHLPDHRRGRRAAPRHRSDRGRGADHRAAGMGPVLA